MFTYALDAPLRASVADDIFDHKNSTVYSAIFPDDMTDNLVDTLGSGGV